MIAAQCVATSTRFFRALDAADYDQMLRLLAPDATWLRGEHTLAGREEIRAALSRRPVDRKTCHILCNPDVDVISSQQACVRFYLMAYEREASDQSTKASIRTCVDELHHINGVWLIARKSSSVLMPLN